MLWICSCPSQSVILMDGPVNPTPVYCSAELLPNYTLHKIPLRTLPSRESNGQPTGDQFILLTPPWLSSRTQLENSGFKVRQFTHNLYQCLQPGRHDWTQHQPNFMRSCCRPANPSWVCRAMLKPSAYSFDGLAALNLTSLSTHSGRKNGRQPKTETQPGLICELKLDSQTDRAESWGFLTVRRPRKVKQGGMQHCASTTAAISSPINTWSPHLNADSYEVVAAIPNCNSSPSVSSPNSGWHSNRIPCGTPLLPCHPS